MTNELTIIGFRPDQRPAALAAQLYRGFVLCVVSDFPAKPAPDAAPAAPQQQQGVLQLRAIFGLKGLLCFFTRDSKIFALTFVAGILSREFVWASSVIVKFKARDNLVKLKPILAQSMHAALGVFYEKLKVTPEVRKFFNDERHMVSAQDRQEKHWSIIADAKFDSEYLEGILRVGKTHARIGLEPRWYIGGYALVLEQLIHVIVKDQWPKLMQLGRSKPEGVAEALSSLVKATMLDMDFAISTYLDTLEDQRKTAQAAELATKQQAESAVATIGFALSKLAQKDLTFRIDTNLPPAFSQLQADFNDALMEIAQAISGVSEGMSAMHSGAKEITVASDDLARRTEQQAASLEETAAALAEITGTAKKASDGANHARKIVMAADENAKHSTTIVRQASEQLHELMSQFIIGNQQLGDPLRRELQNVAPHVFQSAQGGQPKTASTTKSAPLAKAKSPAPRQSAAKVVNGSDSGDWQEF
eukprot:gene6996-7065_t